MAKVSICDWCKSISKDDFEHFISLKNELKEEEHYEVCLKCYVTLVDRLSNPEIPQVLPPTPVPLAISTDSIPIPSYYKDMIQNNGVPTEALLAHEVNKVPSRRDEVVEDDTTCKHKYDMMQNSVGEMYMACVKCDKKMSTESIA